ncbi:MAG: cation transporter [Flavobacterium sp.]|nr:MAG: cation transporter [Flavobacterium sp.]
MNFKKSFLALSLAGLVFTSCKQTAAEPTKDATATTENSIDAAPGKIETASFSIEGMSCEVMCASKIQKELAKTEGVQTAKVDFEKKTATVEYDSGKTTPEQLVKTVEAVNGGESYKVSNVKSSADHAMFFPKEKEKKKSKKEKKAEAEKAASTEEIKSEKPGCCKSKKSCSSSEAKKENTL